MRKLLRLIGLGRENSGSPANLIKNELPFSIMPQCVAVCERIRRETPPEFTGYEEEMLVGFVLAAWALNLAERKQLVLSEHSSILLRRIGDTCRSKLRFHKNDFALVICHRMINSPNLATVPTDR
jgi:hypothetical protein